MGLTQHCVTPRCYLVSSLLLAHLPGADPELQGQKRASHPGDPGGIQEPKGKEHPALLAGISGLDFSSGGALLTSKLPHTVQPRVTLP